MLPFFLVPFAAVLVCFGLMLAFTNKRTWQIRAVVIIMLVGYAAFPAQHQPTAHRLFGVDDWFTLGAFPEYLLIQLLWLLGSGAGLFVVIYVRDKISNLR
ncbi:MAG: hypothetical protein GJ680_07615 [Alteromonadaceae bacterium]|nr:hypothetical protein [Alteromonadaceae bacterium]